MEATEARQIKAWCGDRACFDELAFSCYLRPAPRNPRPWLLRRLRYAFWRLRCVSLLLTEPGFGSVSNFQLCCDVLRFFWFLYCCCKYVTSSAHQASTPWYATTPVRHLVGAVCFIFFTIRTKIVCQHFRYRHRHRLHRQFHHRCIVGIFDSRPMQLTKVKFFNIYRNTTLTSLTHILIHSPVHAHTHTHTNSPSTPPSLLYFLFPSFFSVLSLSLEKLVTCGVNWSYNFAPPWSHAHELGWIRFPGKCHYQSGRPPLRGGNLRSRTNYSNIGMGLGRTVGTLGELWDEFLPNVTKPVVFLVANCGKWNWAFSRWSPIECSLLVLLLQEW